VAERVEFWRCSDRLDMDGAGHGVGVDELPACLSFRIGKRATRSDHSAAVADVVSDTGVAANTYSSRRLLVRAVGEAAALAATLLGVDLGRRTEADRFLTLAQDAAKENEDSDLAAVVLACRAFVTSFDGGSPTVAAEFADAAVEVASRDLTSMTTRGWVAAVSSEHFAVVGDERRSLSRLDEARAALSEPVSSRNEISCLL